MESAGGKMEGVRAHDRQPARRGGNWLKRSRKRLERDFYLTVLAVFSLLAVIALSPFFVYRLTAGHVEAALANGAVVILLVTGFAYAWMTGRTKGVRTILVICITAICTYMVVLVGHWPFWVFPTLVANFMLVNWRFALVVNLAMVLVVVFLAPFFDQPVELASFVTAVFMVGFFSLVFVSYANFHRDRLGALVERDPLTGAFNRRALATHLEHSLSAVGRFGHEHALVLLDLDDFKRVNDQFGHEVGDRVLVDFASLLIQDSRRGDLLYRLGGDEFVLLLTNTDRDGAEVAVNKLHRQIQDCRYPEAGAVQVSIGAAASRPKETWQQWLSRADRAMYLAKATGKNRVVFAE